jgi:hypothetical protein
LVSETSTRAASLKKSFLIDPLPLPLIEQSRQAEYDRLTALPGVEPDGWAMSGERTINGPRDVATKLAR